MTFSQPEQSSSQEPRRLLITGGAGFIGSNFVHHWCEHYKSDRVVVLDALLESFRNHWNRRETKPDYWEQPNTSLS